MLFLHALRERFFPDFSVLHLDTRRIFLPERRRRLDDLREFVILLELRLTRRILLELERRLHLRRVLLILRQYPTREPFFPVTHVQSSVLAQTFLPRRLAALTRRIFLPERLRRQRFDDFFDFFDDNEERHGERRTRRIFLPERLRHLDDLRDRRRRDAFLAHDGTRICLPERAYTPLRYEQVLLLMQGPRFLAAHFLPR